MWGGYTFAIATALSDAREQAVRRRLLQTVRGIARVECTRAHAEAAADLVLDARTDHGHGAHGAHGGPVGDPAATCVALHVVGWAHMEVDACREALAKETEADARCVAEVVSMQSDPVDVAAQLAATTRRALAGESFAHHAFAAHLDRAPTAHEYRVLIRELSRAPAFVAAALRFNAPPLDAISPAAVEVQFETECAAARAARAAGCTERGVAAAASAQAAAYHAHAQRVVDAMYNVRVYVR